MRELAVTDDAGTGIVLMERLQQLKQGMLLSRRTGVDLAALWIQASFVADAERTAVVASGMNTSNGLGQDGNNVAIATDIVVVGGLTEAGFARSNQFLDRELAVAARSGAVDDEEFHVVVIKWNYWHNNLIDN